MSSFRIKIWSISTGECLQTIENAHEASVLSIAFDEQTGFMVSGGSDCKINVWDLGGKAFFLCVCRREREGY